MAIETILIPSNLILVKTLAFIFVPLGLIFVYISFYNTKIFHLDKEHQHGHLYRRSLAVMWFGVLFMFCGGSLMILYYSMLPPSPRITNEELEGKVPEFGFEVQDVTYPICLDRHIQ
jgi:hypothetical protein